MFFQVPKTSNSAGKVSTDLKESTDYASIIDHKELTHTIWGDDVKQDVFERWSQGKKKCISL